MRVLDVLSTIGAALLAVTPLAATGAAHAQTVPAVAIQVGDLDFANKADVARFDDRVAQAGEDMCRGVIVDLPRRDACLSAVRDEAVSKLSAKERSEMASASSRPLTWRFAAQ